MYERLEMEPTVICINYNSSSQKTMHFCEGKYVKVKNKYTT